MKIALIGYGWLAKKFLEHLNNKSTELDVTITRRAPFKREAIIVSPGFSLSTASLIIRENDIVGDTSFLNEMEKIFVFIPPSDQYPAQVAQLLKSLSPTASLILVSSTGVFSEKGLFVESSKVQALTPRSTRIWQAERKVLAHQKGYIIRSAGQIGPDRLPAKSLSQRENDSIEDSEVNVIHCDDLVRILGLYLDNAFVEKIVHAVSPHHPLKSTFYGAQAKGLGLTLPRFRPTKNSKIISSEVLAKYKFKWSNPECV